MLASLFGAPVLAQLEHRIEHRIERGLHELRLRALGVSLGVAAGLAGIAFLGLAAYRGLARVMAPELAALLLGLLLLAGAALAFTRSRRASTRLAAEAAPAREGDGTDELARALAALLREVGVDGSAPSTAGLVAGFTLGSRRRSRRD